MSTLGCGLIQKTIGVNTVVWRKGCPVRLVTVIQPQNGLIGNDKVFIERIYIMFNPFTFVN